MSESNIPPTTHQTAGQRRFSSRTTIFLILAMLALLFAIGSQDKENVDPTLQASGTAITPQATTVPTDVPVTANDTAVTGFETTTGLILGAIFLLLIIIIGTFGVIRHKE